MRGIYRPIRSISKLSARIAKAIVRGEKVMEILEIMPEVMDREGAVPVPRIKGRIRFEKITFGYVKDNYILHDFSCRIPRSKTTVIIGPTGAGKSTLAKLLLRLYEPQEGIISIDGRDISEFEIQSLRRKITSLTQETFLFQTSLKDNIAFGKHRASQQEIEKAAQMVGADQFIKRLPEGYDTIIGGGGLTLSGGQRQLVSFARAALLDSAIMIFDEPATGLDIHAEKEAKEALRTLKPHRVVIIITHRLNFLELADWTVFIRDGKLVEEGKPMELFHQRGDFYDYVSHEITRTGYSQWPGGPVQTRIDGI
jgi:ABC-type multidrug transport system fused ATPase/permease subunit